MKKPRRFPETEKSRICRGTADRPRRPRTDRESAGKAAANRTREGRENCCHRSGSRNPAGRNKKNTYQAPAGAAAGPGNGREERSRSASRRAGRRGKRTAESSRAVKRPKRARPAACAAAFFKPESRYRKKQSRPGNRPHTDARAGRERSISALLK